MAARKKKSKAAKSKPKPKAKNVGGRPVKLCPEVQDAICQAMRAGNYLEPSAVRAGVSVRVVYDWLKRAGREEERVRNHGGPMLAKELPFVTFLHAIKAAEADAEARDVAIISKAALQQWQAAAWRLERKHYQRWGRRQAIEHSSPEGKPVRVQKLKIGDDEIEF